MHTHVCISGGTKCSFFRKFNELYFLLKPISRFALLPYYRRIMKNSQTNVSSELGKSWIMQLALLVKLVSTDTSEKYLRPFIT